jgi:hypothetical protein
LAGVTDRIDGRWVFAGCSLLAAGASFVFAGCADGFWAALVLRFLNGVALAGVHMPGLKLLVDRVAGRARARGAAIYTSSYAVGAAASFLVAGFVDAIFGWRASFIASGIGPLLAIAAITLLPAVAEPLPAGAFVLDFRPVLRDRALMAYVLAFAGNTWEVFAVRVWFVAYLAWTLSLPHNYLPLPGLAVISGLASLAGFPGSIAVGELALRYGRRVIVATCLTSAEHWNTLDAVALHEPGHLLKGGLLGDRYNIPGHYLLDLTPMRVRVFLGKRSDVDQELDQSLPMQLGADLCPPQEVALGHDPDEPTTAVDHWQSTDFVQQHHTRCLRH